MLFKFIRGEIYLPITIFVFGGIFFIENFLLGIFSIHYLSSCNDNWEYTVVFLQIFFKNTLVLFWAIGAWRASSLYSKKFSSSAGRLAKALVVVILTFNAYQLFANVIFIYRVESIYNTASSSLSGGVQLKEAGVVTIDGMITEKTQFDFIEILNNHQITSVVLNSTGGYFCPAQSIGFHIKSKKIDTQVTGECTSACTLLFSTGNRRFASRKAIFGFHSFSVGSVRADTANSKVQAIYLEAGISGSFIEKALRPKSNEIWYPEFDELLNSNFVTDEIN